MDIYAAISLSMFHISLAFGIYVLLLDSRNRVHRWFFLLALSEGLWNFFTIFVFSADTVETLWPRFRIGATFGIFFVSNILPFVLILTRARQGRWWIPLNYLLSLPVHYRNWTSFLVFERIEKVGSTWVFHPALYSIGVQYWILYSHGSIIISLILLYRWWKRADTERFRRQSRIVFYSLLLFFIGGSANDLIIAHRLGIPVISPFYFIIFLAGTWYAIVKYRFLSITHKTVCKDILENMDVAVLLLDPELRIMMINKQAQRLLEHRQVDVIGEQVARVLGDDTLLKEGFRRLLEGRIEKLSYTMQVPRRDELLGLQITLSLVRDWMGELLGVLLIGQEIKGLKQFMSRFHLTWREWEIIQQVLSGATNRSIAEHLQIKERTVKSHVTHIYNKLGIRNRVELLKLIENANLPYESPLKRIEKPLLRVKASN
ncbi:MAG: LuxR C-terminal-related transcriptional regulator [Spirochaetes bacterium]|nr:LuxR C-terminal-related transcriptional regulator [Spirochaetota bacterium]